MRILKQSLALVALGSLLVIAPAAAQMGGTGAFQWYVGGHGGVTSFRTAIDGRELWPTAGGHILITAKRTGLLLSVDQGFGSDDRLVSTVYEIRDADGAVIESGTEDWTFDGIRRYSAILHGLSDPQPEHPALRRRRGRHRAHHQQPQPVGLAHRGRQRRERAEQRGVRHGGGRPGIPGRAVQRLRPVPDHHEAGLSAGGDRAPADTAGDPTLTRIDGGEWTLGAFHALTGGLRFSLGSARESSTARRLLIGFAATA